MNEIETSIKSYNYIYKIFLFINDYHSCPQIISFIESRQQDICNYFEQHSGLSNYIISGWHKYLLELEIDDPYNKPEIIINISCILNHLQSEEGMFEKNVLYEIRSLLKLFLKKYSELAKEQIKLLNTLINKIVEAVIRFKGVNIYLLECPVGNSIPTKLLYNKLKKSNIESAVIKVALSRNDTVSKGITRKQLIENKILSLNFNSSSLVIYIDEWITGSNFNSLSVHLSNILKKTNSWFFPAAYMITDSKNKSRYSSFIQKHDEYLSKLNLSGIDYRIELPLFIPENNKYPFFFSEHDRLAGYRKMQILGSIFSTFDYAIEELKKSNDDIIRSFKQLYIENGIKEEFEKYSPDEIVKNEKIILDLFNESYQDYQLLKVSLLSIEHASNGGEFSDLYEDSREVTHLFAEQIERRPAKRCILLATVFLDINHSINPSDRYFFPNHVPVISLLSDNMILLHNYFMEILPAIIE